MVKMASQEKKPTASWFHKSPRVHMPLHARILALSIEKLKLDPINLLDHQILVLKTSSTLARGRISICLANNFYAVVIRFHILEPRVTEGLWTINHAWEGNQ